MKRFLCFFMICALILTLAMPAAAFAEDTPVTEETTSEEPTAEPVVPSTEEPGTEPEEPVAEPEEPAEEPEQPEEKTVKIPKKCFVDKTDKKYSYKDMEKDLKQLEETYWDRIHVSSLGTTADKRKIYCVCMGNPKAKKQIVVTASIHAREYINTPMIMYILERYCRQYDKGKYQKKTYRKLFEKTCVYVVPMANPDGVAISQYGPKAIRDRSLRRLVQTTKKYKNTYRKWKANARAIDINRNWSSGFGKGYLHKKRYSENYCGKRAMSEAEVKALKKLVTKKCKNCKTVINLHTMGEVFYWGYTGKTKKAELKLKKIVRDTTGYWPIRETGAGDGDFEHYLKNVVKVPYVCIENGKGLVPNKHSQFTRMYKKNRTLLEQIAGLYY